MRSELPTEKDVAELPARARLTAYGADDIGGAGFVASTVTSCDSPDAMMTGPTIGVGVRRISDESDAHLGSLYGSGC